MLHCTCLKLNLLHPRKFKSPVGTSGSSSPFSFLFYSGTRSWDSRGQTMMTEEGEEESISRKREGEWEEGGKKKLGTSSSVRRGRERGGGGGGGGGE